MERQYLYYHTCAGFFVLIVGFLLIIIGLPFLFRWLPESKWIQIMVMLFSSIGVVWAAIRVDEWSVNRRKRNLITIGTGSRESKNKSIKGTHQPPSVG
jgi:hypothetical protein